MTVYDEIAAERTHQDQRWGHRVDDKQNTPWMWASYIAQYSTKWMDDSFIPIGHNTTDAFRKAMIKTAAICVAAVESLDRQRAARGLAFYE